MAKREPKSIRCSGYPVETKSGKLVWYVHAPADNPNGVFLPDAEYRRLKDIEKAHKAIALEAASLKQRVAALEAIIRWVAGKKQAPPGVGVAHENAESRAAKAAESLKRFRDDLKADRKFRVRTYKNGTLVSDEVRPLSKPKAKPAKKKKGAKR